MTVRGGTDLSVPKHRHKKSGRQGIAQKAEYSKDCYVFLCVLLYTN